LAAISHTVVKTEQNNGLCVQCIYREWIKISGFRVCAETGDYLQKDLQEGLYAIFWKIKVL